MTITDTGCPAAPANLYLARRDDELVVKILDFGIAKLTGTLANVSPRTTGTMGTPAYMAPEQWGDASKVDRRADLYSLGCVAFEMACGRPPFIVTTLYIRVLAALGSSRDFLVVARAEVEALDHPGHIELPELLLARHEDGAEARGAGGNDVRAG